MLDAAAENRDGIAEQKIGQQQRRIDRDRLIRELIDLFRPKRHVRKRDQGHQRRRLDELDEQIDEDGNDRA
jgi:hypothetical protein